MLVVHWTPVKNTNAIRRNGIAKSKRGVFCFPLTGHAYVDRWWARALRRWRPRTQYNGFVFRIVENDLPARFYQWVGESIGKPKAYHSIEELQAEFRKIVVFYIGVEIAGIRRLGWHADYAALGEEIMRSNPATYARHTSDAHWMDDAFMDFQIVLSHSIAPERIIRVMSGSADSGRGRVRRFRTERRGVE